jgi:hypothetical protein
VSQIASFYVLPADLTEKLLAAATPESIVTKKRVLGLFTTTSTTQRDNFWDYLWSIAKESADYEYSGSVFCEFDLFLQEKHTMLFGLCLKEPSDRLSVARQSSMALFDFAAAQKVLEMLERVDASPDAIRRYIEAEENSWTAEELIEPLQAAIAFTKTWMKDIGPTQVGLLTVG